MSNDLNSEVRGKTIMEKCHECSRAKGRCLLNIYKLNMNWVRRLTPSLYSESQLMKLDHNIVP